MTEAQVAAGRGDDANAERLFREALDAPEATPGVKWVAHDGLAQLAATANRPADAARHFEAALQTVEQTRSALLKADYRISFTSRLIEFYNRYVELLLAEGQVERALEVADSSRGRVLAERQNVAAAPARTSAAGLKQLARQTRTTIAVLLAGANAVVGLDRDRRWHHGNAADATSEARDARRRASVRDPECAGRSAGRRQQRG